MSEIYIYKKPTVKKVIFQIRFSNLFLIESKIGEIQSEIIEKFPESEYNIRQSIIFAEVSKNIKEIKIPDDDQDVNSKKIWSFYSEKKENSRYNLNILTDSIDISSEKHKSYYSTEKNEGFRDIIQYVIEPLLKIIPISKIKRIGLRYIDECPIPDKIEEFKNWYNSSLSVDRFDLNSIITSYFRTDILNGQNGLVYQENIRKNNSNKLVYNLDFDGYRENIHSSKIIETLDELHKIVHLEWEKSIKQPVKDWMNTE